jgi:hypothetical protein
MTSVAFYVLSEAKLLIQRLELRRELPTNSGFDLLPIFWGTLAASNLVSVASHAGISSPPPNDVPVVPTMSNLL